MITDDEINQISEIVQTEWYRNYIRRPDVKRINEDQQIISRVMMDLLHIVSPLINEKMEEGADNIEKVDTFFKLINLLAACEGVISNLMDSFMMYFIENEHADLWDDKSSSFLTEYNQVKRVFTSIKIEFLKVHGIELFDRLFPRRLRNAFSHMNFRIEDNGNITTYNFKGNPQTPAIEKTELMAYFNEVTDFLNFFAEIIS